jgi:hypothetical protein
MRILVSGEGVSDMGRCLQGDACDDPEFEPGPMALLADQVIEAAIGYPCYPYLMRLVSKPALAARSKALMPPKLAGRKSPKETALFYRNARALAQLAAELAAESQDEVVAILFRDADRTKSTERGDWRDKVQSMLNGFAFEGFEGGVPMVPNPKSEAWLLCALKGQQPYQHCESLEGASGNDASENSLKAQLAAALGEHPGASLLASLVQQGRVDAHRIDMPSFNQFKRCLGHRLHPRPGTTGEPDT